MNQDKFKKQIGEDAYILAEMAASHEGKKKIAEFIIEKAALSKADGILFQMINLDTYIIPHDEDWQDVKSFYMDQKTWAELIKKANSSGLDVWANVCDLASAKFCKDKKIRGFKLLSANLENEDLIREVVGFKKDLLLSIGGMKKEEIKRVVKLIYSFNGKAKIYLMYGLQNFPTNPEGVNLNFIESLSKELLLSFGYQDHSEPTSAASTYLPVLALAKGAVILEKHITHDRGFKGQDYQAALNPDEFVDFVRDIRTAEKIIAKNPEEVSSEELKYRDYEFLIKVVAKKDIKAGSKFNKENLMIMRSKNGEIRGRYLKSLFGKKARYPYKKFEPIKREELFRVGILITVRLWSGRLPFKAMKPILGKPMVERMIERLKYCQISPIIVTTSVNPGDTPLAKIAQKTGVECFRGSEEDVLGRMRDCARKFNIDLVINATGDDPLKEPIFVKKLVERYLERKFDFCKIEGLPNGCETYAISRKGLEKACEIKSSSNTEYWGTFFNNNERLFKCDVINVSDPAIYRPQYRVTVDTKEDFKVVEKIFRTFLKKKKNFNIYDICKLLDENKDLIKVNAKIKQAKGIKIKIKSKYAK